MIAYINPIKWYETDLENKRIAENEHYQSLINYIGQLESSEYTLKLKGAEQGQQLALAINEPFWYLYFSCEKASALGNLRRFQEWLDETVRLIVEINNDKYAQCPYKVFAYIQLIRAYYFDSCIKHSKEILEAIHYVESNLPMSQFAHANLINTQCEVLVYLERWEDAKEATIKYQSLTERYDYPFYQSALYLAHIAFRLKDYSLLKSQVEVILKTPCQEGYYRFVHNVALYWDAIHRYLMGEKIEKSQQWKSKLIYQKGIRDTDNFTLTAMFHYTRLVQYDYDTNLSNFINRREKSPLEEKQHLLRYYYLLVNAPQSAILNMEAMNFMVHLPFAKNVSPYINNIINVDSNPLFRLFGIVFFVIILLISLKIIVPIRLKFVSPLKRTAKELLLLIQNEDEREFFEERLRWIDEKRDYIP